MLAIPTPYKYAAAGILLISVFGAGFVKGLTYESDRHTAEKVALQKKYDESVLHNAEVMNRQANITKGVEDAYRNRIDSINNYYSRLFHGSGSSSVPGVSKPSSGFDAASAYYKLAPQCAATTEQLIALQEWVNKQRGVK